MDLDTILARQPKVALVDDLAHNNAPGGKNLKRYQDVQILLDAGIHVISTLNIQHLESLYDTVETLVGVKVHERLPDSVLFDADEIVNVDLAPQDLLQRLREGKVYPKERVSTALENFFQPANLDELRELASQIDIKRRSAPKEEQREAPTVIDATTQRYLLDTLTLANALGAMVFTYKGEDIADTILHFAREYRVGHIVIGRPSPLPFWKNWLG